MATTSTMPDLDSVPVRGMNPWEDEALRYGFPEDGPGSQDATESKPHRRPLQDPIIYPGLYSGSGLDVMSILFRVFSRQNPQIDIGPVDASVAMTISDLNHPDHPIIYASDPFYELTGFSREEVLGKNALFLQAPLSRQHLQDTPITENDLSGIQTMQQAMQKHFECQLEISSFKKSGQRFKNVISIIPVYIPETGARYAVGLNVEDM